MAGSQRDGITRGRFAGVGRFQEAMMAQEHLWCCLLYTSNPYPPYFYGTVEDALGKTAVAIGLFEQAIEMDTKPGNPAFPEALRLARAKLQP